MTKITLYHAKWCHHCKTFKPVWDSLKQYFDKHNIIYKDYEDSLNPNIIKKDNIQYFPTIIIEKDNIKYEYNGDKSADGLIKELIPNIQLGGYKKIIKKYKINYYCTNF